MIIGILIISITCVLIACITSNTIKNIYSLKYLGRPYDPLMEELEEWLNKQPEVGDVKYE